MKELNIYDVTIIGGGPVGLFACFYAGLRSLNVHVIESLQVLGGQPQHLYPQKKIYDIPAYPVITGSELSDKLIEQSQRFNPTYTTGETVTDIQKISDDPLLYQIRTTQNIYHSKVILIAAGNGAFTPRPMKLANIDSYSQSIHYAITDILPFQDKHVVVFGGGDSAVDWALELQAVAKSVSLVHRRDVFRALESSVNQLKESDVTLYTGYQPIRLIGANNQLTHIELQHIKSRENKSINAQEIVVAYGHTMSLGPIKNWGFNIIRNGIEVDIDSQTNLPGVYAIGDVAYHEHKIKLIATGFSEAIQAISHAIRLIHPEAAGPVHSTDLIEEE